MFFKTIKSIWEIGDRWQTAQDVLTIDGPEIGQKPGNHIEHIDDLFLRKIYPYLFINLI